MQWYEALTDDISMKDIYSHKELMTYLNGDGNAKLADTLSIVSFSIISISMAVQMSMQEKINTRNCTGLTRQ